MFADMGEQSFTDISSGVLTIDLGALTSNYQMLQAQLTPARAAAVVKADAYSLGAARVAPALYKAGCRDFFVAQVGEGLKLRPSLAEDARIYVLNGLQPGAEVPCARAGLIPVLNSLEQVANWSALATRLAIELPALVQFDTGMSRLGLSETEVATLAAEPGRLAGVKLLYVMSHLACADEPENPQNATQLANMRRFASAFPGIPVCFANSGGIFLGTDFHNALARPGIALYGGAPTAGLPNPMQPVIRLDVPVIQTRTVPAGTRVGYGGTFVATGETRLAAIGVGYADGLPRHLSGVGAAYYGNVRLPFAGRVSMDSLLLDVTALSPGALKLGAMVEIIGPHQTLDEVATAAGTISYEILTSLGGRYHRVYR